MKAAIRCTLIAICLALLVAVGGGVLLLFASKWLAISDRPEATDAMLVLAGDPSRALHAAELYSKGLVPLVYVSKPAHMNSQKLLGELGIPYPPQEQLYQEVLVRKDVPSERIRILGNALQSTVDEAVAVRELGAGRHRTMLVVTSPYHVRRVKMIFEDTLPHIRVIVVANPHEPYPERWWTNQDVARNVLLEVVKIAFYLAGGRFTSAAEQPKGQ